MSSEVKAGPDDILVDELLLVPYFLRRSRTFSLSFWFSCFWFDSSFWKTSASFVFSIKFFSMSELSFCYSFIYNCLSYFSALWHLLCAWASSSSNILFFYLIVMNSVSILKNVSFSFVSSLFFLLYAFIICYASSKVVIGKDIELAQLSGGGSILLFFINPSTCLWLWPSISTWNEFLLELSKYDGIESFVNY